MIFLQHSSFNLGYQIESFLWSSWTINTEYKVYSEHETPKYDHVYRRKIEISTETNDISVIFRCFHEWNERTIFHKTSSKRGFFRRQSKILSSRYWKKKNASHQRVEDNVRICTLALSSPSRERVVFRNHSFFITHKQGGKCERTNQSWNCYACKRLTLIA